MGWLRTISRNYLSVLIAQFFLLFLAAFMKEFVIFYGLFVFAMLWVFGSVIANIWETMVPRILALMCGLVALVTGFVWAVPGITESAVHTSFIICTIAYAAFVLIAIVSIGRSVFFIETSTSNRILGSLCIYMLLGMFFAFLYAGLDLMRPDAIDFRGAEASDLGSFGDYLYFSYVTLTTTGFGDIVPVRPLARLLAYLETVVGSMFLVVVVASFVAIHVSRAAARHFSKEG